MTSSVEECALRARSTHGVHHAIVEVNIVIGVVLGEVLVALVVPLVVDAACCYRRFRRSHFLKRISCMGDILFTASRAQRSCLSVSS